MDDEPILIDFPFKGVDVSRGLFDQREGTSPFAVNVRGYDANGRLRGGTRPGLTPYFGKGSTEQVSGFHKIQSLSAIVTASQGATFSSVFDLITLRIHYSETNNPPARDSPTTDKIITWYRKTKPGFTGITEAVIGVPDGGGTGKGTASFKISATSTLVTLVATFQSAGFPPAGSDYFYSGPGKVQTLTQSTALFFNPVTSQLSSNWTVIAGSFIGNYFFNVFYPAP